MSRHRPYSGRKNIEFDERTVADISELMERLEATSATQIVRMCVRRIADQERLVVEKGGHIAHVDPTGTLTLLKYA